MKSRDDEGPSGDTGSLGIWPPITSGPPATQCPGSRRPHPSCPLSGAAAALHPAGGHGTGCPHSTPSEPGGTLGGGPHRGWGRALRSRDGLQAPGWRSHFHFASSPADSTTRQEEPGPHALLCAQGCGSPGPLASPQGDSLAWRPGDSSHKMPHLRVEPGAGGSSQRRWQMARLFREEQGWVRLEGRSPLVEQHLLGVRSLEASWHSGGGWAWGQMQGEAGRSRRAGGGGTG